MKLHTETDQYKLYEGSMLDMLGVIEPNSIDAIVTDPPYELGFMGKSWDKSGIAFQKETWEKCLQVLKPGGYLLSFGGSRTFHRIACAIEDAGFEIRDTIMWLFGCYSSDTQVLTNSGWKYFYDLDRTEKVLQWDKDTNELSWVNPLNYFEYDVDTEMCLFENRHISQFVTPNHKVVAKIKRRRKDYLSYDFTPADEFMKSWIVSFPLAGNLLGTTHEPNAYIIGWWLTDAWKHLDGKACMFSQSKPETLLKLRNYFDTHNVKYSEYIKHYDNPKHNDEHTFYFTGDLATMLLTNYPDRRLTWDVLSWDTESRSELLRGLMDGDGSIRPNEYSHVFWSKNVERCDIVQALCLSLNYRSMIYYKHGEVNGVVYNTAHNSTEIQTKHHKPNVPYVGKVYCLETETGAFVVRRNGKAFISGNSGFPKSMNIGLSVDKKNGIESKIIGTKEHCKKDFKENNLYAQDPANANNTRCFGYGTEIIKKAQNEYDGYGTSLKPAYEPIIIARKPCEGSTTDNVIKYGVGGINIDECRIPTDDTLTHGGPLLANSGDDRTGKSLGMFQDGTENTYVQNPQGRFPSNVILTYSDSDFDEVCGGMPYTKSTGGSGEESRRSTLGNFDGGWNRDIECANLGGLGDEGSAARYFYCAKASKLDRDEGLDNFEYSIGGGMLGTKDQSLLTGSGNVRNNLRKNNHPTVKPTSLMQYLVRLVTPKNGTILDPFNGSGSTGKAVMLENRSRNANYKYIGIDLSEEYLRISKARIDYAMVVDMTVDKDGKVKTAKPDNSKNPPLKQINLFEI